MSGEAGSPRRPSARSRRACAHASFRAGGRRWRLVRPRPSARPLGCRKTCPWPSRPGRDQRILRHLLRARCRSICAPGGRRALPDQCEDRPVRLAGGHAEASARARGETSQLRPMLVGNAELLTHRVARRCAHRLGRQDIGQIPRLVERPDLDLALPKRDVKATLHRGPGHVHVLDLPDVEGGDQFMGVGERSVDYRAGRTVEGDALGLCAGCEASAGQHDPGVDQLLGKPVHRLEHLKR